MNKKMRHTLQKYFFALLLLTVSSCQKNSSDNNTPAPVAQPPVVTAPHQFGYHNGTCYDLTINAPTAVTNCGQLPGANNMGTNGYIWNGTNCVSASGQIAPNPSYCNNNGLNQGGLGFYGSFCLSLNGQNMNNPNCLNQNQNTYPNQCLGTYVYYSQGLFTTINCYGTFCRGLTLMEFNSGRQIVCQ